ncbi:RNA-dependent RNA polymerase, partial [Rhizoctonia solani]
MDTPTNVQAVTFTALASLAFVLLCYLLRWPTVRHPPSPMSFPLVGNLFSIPPGHEYIAFAKLGEELKSDTVFLKIFSQKIVVLNSTDVATEILDKRSAFHSDRPFIPMVADASLMNWSRVPSLIEYSDTWRQYRRVMGNWLNKRAVTQFNDMQEQQTRSLLRRLLGVTKRTQPFEHVKNEFFFATGSLMLQLAYGYRPWGPQDPFLKEVQLAIHNILSATMQTHWFPWTRWKRTGKEWGVQQEKAKAMPYEWLKQQVANGSHQPSLLAPLVKDHEMLSNLTSSEKDELLKEVGIVLFAGGTDTVRSPNFVAAMILNPDVQEKAQRELDAVLGHTTLPEMSHKERLPYTRNLIEEVFRLYPVVPLGIPHACYRDDSYQGYYIEKGTTMWVTSHYPYATASTNLPFPSLPTNASITFFEQYGEYLVGFCEQAMGRDPRYYLNTETFDPDRYLDPQTPRAPRFGWGRRKCPGAHFAEASIFMIVASLLTTFTFSRKRTEDGQEIVPQVEAERDSMMLELKPFDFEIQVRTSITPLARTQYKMAKAKKNETEAEGKAPERKGPAVIGINFGNAYASIAVINNEGEPDCIANEDGERQIAAALSYFGLEEYIGNQAKPQLVKNSQNTITNFRNQLGKKWVVRVTQAGPSTSAPIIDHEDQPAYKVTILTPAPPPSAAPTPKATPLPTRPASPIPQEKTLTAHDVSVLFLKSLLQSAVDFLGRPIEGAVLSVNTGWNDAQRAALKRAAEEAGIKVLQLLDEAAAAALAYTDAPPVEDASHALKSDDKTTLVVDLGAASLSLTLLSSKQGLYHTIGSSHSSTVGGDSIDDLLLTHFGKEFTKKTKVPVTLPCTSPGTPDQRADAKMRLAVEHTKRTISAGPGAAACAVESLKDGVDFSGTLNRLRFDMLVAKVYGAVVDEVKKLLDSAGVDPTLVDEVILVGGSAALPGLAERLEGLFGENTAIRSEIDPGQVLALGCALQAKHIISAQNDIFAQGVSAPVTSKILGLVFAGDDSTENWIPLVAAGTPLPARRLLRFPVPAGQIGFEIWEGVDAVDVKKVAVEQDEDDEEEPEEEEIRTRIVKKDSALGGGVVDIKGKKGAKLLVQAIVSAEGKVDGNMERARVDSLVLPPATMAHVMKQKHGRPRHPRILRRTKNYQVFEQDIPRVYPFMLGYGGMGRIDLDAVANQPEATLGAETPPSSMSETLVEQVPEETDQVAMGVNSALVTSSVPQTLVPIQTTPIALLTSTPITFSVSVAVSATSTTTSSVPLAALITSSVAVSTSAPAPSSMVAAVTVLATSETTSSPFSPVSPSVVEIITSVSLVPSPSATSATQALKQKYPYALYVAFGLVILILLCAICASIAWVLRRRRKRKEAENDLWIGSVLNDEPDGKDGYELEKGVDEGGPGMAGVGVVRREVTYPPLTPPLLNTWHSQDTPMPNNRNSTSGALYGFTPAHVRQLWRHSSLLQRGGPAAIDGVHHGLDGGGLTFRQDPNGGLTLDTRGIGPEGRVSYPNPHAALASAAPSHYSYGREGPFAVTNLMPGDISSRASETSLGRQTSEASLTRLAPHGLRNNDKGRPARPLGLPTGRLDDPNPWRRYEGVENRGGSMGTGNRVNDKGWGDALRSGIYSAVGRIVGVEETKLEETKEAKSAEQEKDRFTELVQRRYPRRERGVNPKKALSDCDNARIGTYDGRSHGGSNSPESSALAQSGSSPDAIKSGDARPIDWLEREPGQHMIPDSRGWIVEEFPGGSMGKIHIIATGARDRILRRLGSNSSVATWTTVYSTDTDPVFSSESATTTRANTIATSRRDTISTRRSGCVAGLTDADRARKIAYDRFNQKSEQAYQQRETSDEDSDAGHPEQLDLNIPGKFQFGSSEPETIRSDDDHSDSMDSDLIAQFEEVELRSEYGSESTECTETQEGTASQVKGRPPDTAYEIPPDIHKVAFSPEHQKAFDKHGVSWAVQWEIVRYCLSYPDFTWEHVPINIVPELCGPSAQIAPLLSEILLRGESFADYYEKERSMRQPALTNPWEELDREETLIRDRDCGASIDNSGGKIKQRMRLDIVKSDACDFKFTLEQPTRSKSHRFSRFLGSRRLIECYISKNDVRKHTKIIIDFFSRKKLLINGRLFQAFFGQPGKVHLVEINQDFHRDSLPELGDDNRMAFLEFINCHNNLELNSNQGINKWATRFALGFSTSHPGLIFLPEDIHLLHDEYTTGKSKSTAATHEILTDGCGFLNYTALKVIEQKMAWGRFPTCIQARIAGSKGLFMLHPRHRDLSEQPQIWIRESQIKIQLDSNKTKWSPIHRILDVLSGPFVLESASISYEMIMSLSENGVREELLVKMLRDTIGEEARSLEPSLRPHGSEVLYDSIYTTQRVLQSRLRRVVSPDAQRAHGLLDFDDEDGEEEGTALAKWDAGPDPFSGQPASAQEQVLGWLQAGFLPTDKFVMEKLVYLQKKTMEGLVKKYRIVVPHSVRAFIVPDPLGVLNEDEVFFASSQPIEASSSGFTQCITGPVLVSRNPCIQISDTRKVMAVNNYELWSRGYFDVIIFSVKGSRSLASLLSGGDYDGDTVVLIWDEQITSQFRNAHKRFADPGPGFESRNLIKSKKSLKDIKTRADSEGQDITKELISALLEDIAPSQLGMYNIFYRNSVYLYGLDHPTTARLGHMFTQCLDSVKSGLKPKPEVLRADKQIWNKRQPDCFPSKTEEDGTYGSLLPLPRRGSSNRFILEVLQDVAKNEVESYEKKLGEMRDKCEISYRLDQDLIKPLKEAEARVRHPQFQQFQHELQIIVDHVRSFRTRYTESYGNRDKYSTQLPGRKHSKQGRSIAEGQGNIRAVSEAYSRTMPTGLLMFTDSEVRKIAAACAYRNCFCGKLNFCFAVAWSELCAIKAQASGGAFVTLTPGFVESMAIHRKMAKVFRDLERSEPNQVA